MSRSYAPLYQAGHSRRTVLPGLVRSLRPMILELGLSDEQQLGEVDRTVREHLADPRTVLMSHLLVVAWARKPARCPPRPPGRQADQECQTPGLQLKLPGVLRGW